MNSPPSFESVEIEHTAFLILGQMGVGKSTEANKYNKDSMVFNPKFRRSTRILKDQLQVPKNGLKNIIIDDLLSFSSSNFSRLMESLKEHKGKNVTICSIPFFITNVKDSQQLLIDRIVKIIEVMDIKKVKSISITCKNSKGELLNIPVGIHRDTKEYIGYNEPTPGDLICKLDGNRSYNIVDMVYEESQLRNHVGSLYHANIPKDVNELLDKLPSISLPLQYEGSYKVITYSELKKYVEQ